MPSEFPRNDPRNIWQDQPTEPFKMSADELRRKAQERETKSRLEALSSIVVGIILCFVCTWAFARAHEVVPRMGWGLLSIWSLYFTHQVYKWLWPGRLAPDATLNTTLLFCRSVLEKRRDYGRHVWRRSGLPFCFLGLAMVLVPALVKSVQAPRLLVNAVPFFVLLAIWLAIFFPMRKRNQQKLQQEIEELRVFEKENRSGRKDSLG